METAPKFFPCNKCNNVKYLFIFPNFPDLSKRAKFGDRELINQIKHLHAPLRHFMALYSTLHVYTHFTTSIFGTVVAPSLLLAAY